MKTKCNANIECVMSLKWSWVMIKRCQIGFLLQSTHITSWFAPHNHMEPLNMPTSPTKIKRVIAWWIAFIIMEDDECSLIFVKVTNPNIMKVAAKLLCSTHPPNRRDCTANQEPKTGVQLKNLTKLSSSTLVWIDLQVMCEVWVQSTYLITVISQSPLQKLNMIIYVIHDC